MASGAASAPLGRKEPKGALPNVQPKLPFPGIHLPRARLAHCGHSYVVTKTKRSPPPLTRADQTSGLPPVQPARTDVAARFCVVRDAGPTLIPSGGGRSGAGAAFAGAGWESGRCVAPQAGKCTRSTQGPDTNVSGQHKAASRNPSHPAAGRQPARRTVGNLGWPRKERARRIRAALADWRCARVPCQDKSRRQRTGSTAGEAG